MKLLTHPGKTIEEIELGGTYTETRTTFNPLGLLGVGPMFKTREVTRGSPWIMKFPGRIQMTNIKVDFEGEDPWRICMYRDEEFDCWLKVQRPEGWDLELDGVKYTLFGLQPLDHVEAHVWTCGIDCFKDSLDQLSDAEVYRHCTKSYQDSL